MKPYNENDASSLQDYATRSLLFPMTKAEMPDGKVYVLAKDGYVVLDFSIDENLGCFKAPDSQTHPYLSLRNEFISEILGDPTTIGVITKTPQIIEELVSVHGLEILVEGIHMAPPVDQRFELYGKRQ